MQDRFIMIKNKLFEYKSDGSKNLVTEIGATAFSVLTYMAWTTCGQYEFDTTVDLIREIIGLSRNNILVPHLKILQQTGLVLCNKDMSTVKCHERIRLNLKPYYELDGGFEPIPEKIYFDHFHSMRDTTWVIYCFLSMMHNNNFVFDEAAGVVNMTEAYISIRTGISINAIHYNLVALKDHELIEIYPKKNIFIGFDKADRAVFGYDSNRYRVIHKLPQNRIAKG